MHALRRGLQQGYENTSQETFRYLAVSKLLYDPLKDWNGKIIPSWAAII